MTSHNNGEIFSWRGKGVPAAGGNVAPVESPGDDGGRDTDGDAGKSHRVPAGGHNTFLWRGDDLGGA